MKALFASLALTVISTTSPASLGSNSSERAQQVCSQTLASKLATERVPGYQLEVTRVSQTSRQVLVEYQIRMTNSSWAALGAYEIASGRCQVSVFRPI